MIRQRLCRTHGSGWRRWSERLKAAYPYDKANGNTTLLSAWTANQITFGNDLNGNRVVDSGEVITYRRDAGDPTILLREKGGSPQPVVEYVNGLSFEYLDRYGATATSEADVAIVHITLVIAVDRGSGGGATQTLTTDVVLRNRV